MRPIAAVLHEMARERRREIAAAKRRIRKNARQSAELQRRIDVLTTELAQLDRAERGLRGASYPPPDIARLSPREAEVMALLADDLPNKLIGKELHFSERTAKFHISNLLAKYGVDRRAKLVIIARTVVEPAPAVESGTIFGESGVLSAGGPLQDGPRRIPAAS